LDIAGEEEETRAEDRCRQGPKVVNSGYVDTLNRLYMINSLSTAIGGMSTVVAQSIDSRSTRELSTVTGSDSFLIGF